ncbi:MAG: type I methionyl aminopeptidase [Thermodesulfobacteriota bacterium]
MITLKTREEIELMRAANVMVAEILEILRGLVRPGINTMALEQRAEEETRKRGVKAAFKGYYGFPWCLCASLNNVVVHGMPSEDTVLKEGDILGMDFGVLYKGFYGDSAITVPVGEISVPARRLLDVTAASLERAIEAARPDKTLGDIAAAVQGYVEAEGFSVVRDFVGHGIGKELHEPPQVPNFGRAGSGLRLEPGMVLAIEPMINQGGYKTRVLEDGWTAVTVDGALSAHFEHTVAITEDGPYVLSRL